MLPSLSARNITLNKRKYFRFVVCFVCLFVFCLISFSLPVDVNVKTFTSSFDKLLGRLYA